MLSGQGKRISVRAVISRTHWVEDVARIEFTHALQLANMKGTLQGIIFKTNWASFISHIIGVRLWALVDAVLYQFA